MSERKKRIAVIGGGASGMMAAITAARCGADVTVFEKGERVGRKLLLTGNGRCNLTNAVLSEREYNGGDSRWIGEALSRFGRDDTLAFFEGIGVRTKERGGFYYPACEQASVVLDGLRFEMQALGVTLRTEHDVTEILTDRDAPRPSFRVVCRGRERAQTGEAYDRVILACGGKAAARTGSDGSGYRLAEKLGHKITYVTPALVQLRCREDYLKSVAGVRADGVVRIRREIPGGQSYTSADARPSACLEERGEIQLTDYGISGIPVFQLSRHVNALLAEAEGLGRKGQEIPAEIDFLPDISESDFLEYQEARRKRLGDGRTLEEFLNGLVHKKLIQLFLRLCHAKGGIRMSEASPETLAQIYRLCKHFTVHITGSNSFDQAQVCAGGVESGQVGPDMESRIVPGLYIAGELLDVDGRCGGYNLQWAWSSGYLAGRGAAGKESEEKP